MIVTSASLNEQWGAGVRKLWQTGADMRRTLIVGDIHGCFAELVELCRIVGLGSDDLLVSTGDLVDRGPRSADVVRFFAACPTRRWSVLGNHEEKHLRGDRNEAEDPSGRVTRASTPAAEYDAMLSYFRTLPLYLDLPEVLVVHAGLLPGVPLGEQPPKVLTGRGSHGRPGFDGKSPWWFDDPAFCHPKPVVFGHSVFPGVVCAAGGKAWGLDTGAAVGGSLTGLVVPGFHLVSVPTPDYYREALRRFLPAFLHLDLPRLPWRRILDTNAGEWPEPVRSRVVAAQNAWKAALSTLAQDVEALRRTLRWAELEPTERARVGRWLRTHPALDTPYGRCLQRAFPGGPDPAVVARSLPDLTSLEAALEARSALPELT